MSMTNLPMTGRDARAGLPPERASVPPGPSEQSLREAGSAARKAMRRLLPFLILMYMTAFLDRSNVGIAKDALHADLGISNAAFALGAGIFFLGYATFEVPSNLIMYRVGARAWMSRIMVTWGLISAAMAFVAGPTSFCAMRLALGVAEAGFFPGVMLYLTFWFPRAIRPRVLGVFYLGYPLAMTLGNPVSGFLFHLDGFLNLHGWQWMFLTEGLLAVVVGIAALFALPNGPSSVSWLTDDEKEALDRALAAEEPERHARGSFLRMLADPVTIGLLLLYALLQIGSYGVVFYLPEQVAHTLHASQGVYVGLVSAVPWACALIVTLSIPGLVQRYWTVRAGVVACLLAFSAGLILSAVPGVTTGLLGLSMAAACIVTVQALYWNLPLSLFTGQSLAVVVALINSVGNLGGFAAPNIRALASDFYDTPKAGLYAIALASVLGIVLTLILPRGTGRKSPARF